MAKPKAGGSRTQNVLSRLQAGMAAGFVPESDAEHRVDEPGVIWVEIDHITASPYQHEEFIAEEASAELVQSIQKDGFYTALDVNEVGGQPGFYFLISGGHQRLKAAATAGLKKLPVFVKPALSSIELAFRTARENAVQVNRSPVNMGMLLLQIQKEFDLTQEEIATQLGKSRNYVNMCMIAARSEPDLQEMLFLKPDSMRALTYLKRLSRREDRIPIRDKFLAGELTTDGVLAAVENVLHPSPALVEHLKDAGEMLPESDDHTPILALVAAETRSGSGAPVADQQVKEGSHSHQVRLNSSLLEAEGKLKAVLSRFDNYCRTRGQQQLSEAEQTLLIHLMEKSQQLLDRRESE